MFASVLALFVAEGALALADYPPGNTDHQRLFVEYDSTRGWRNVPNAAGRFVTGEFTVDLAYNARGYRGPLHPYVKPAGMHRVVLLGDSYVEGYTVALHDRVAEGASAILRQPSGRSPVDIVALGTGGYSTDQEDLWLEAEGLRYAPDLVVVFFVMNDVWYNGQSAYPRGAKPMFHLAGDSLVLANVPVPRLERSASAPPVLGVWHSTKHFVRVHSRLVRLSERAAQRTASLQALGIRLGLIEAPPALVRTVNGRRTVPAEFSVLAEPPSPQADTAIVLTTRLLSRMQARSRAAGARFVVILVPDNEVVYPAGAPQSVRYHRDPAVGDAHRPREVFRDICSRAHVACVDPTPRFVQAADSLTKRNELLVFPEDGHWNEQGHHAAAVVLADLVRRELGLEGAEPGGAISRH